MKNVNCTGFLMSGQRLSWTDKTTKEDKSAIANLGLLVDVDNIDDLSGKIIHPFVHANCDFSEIDFSKIKRGTPVNLVLDTPDGKGLYVLKSISVGK